jgi:transketolase
MRKQFPLTVHELMKKDKRIVVLLGDIGVFAFKDCFKDFPERTFNVGILEQSMVSMAAGLAMAGFIPIVHTISPFLVARAYEQIRDDFGFQRLRGTFVGVDVYTTNPNLGMTHSCHEDIILMSKVVWMKTFIPETAAEFEKLLLENYDNSLNYFRIV